MKKSVFRFSQEEEPLVEPEMPKPQRKKEVEEVEDENSDASSSSEGASREPVTKKQSIACKSRSIKPDAKNV